VYMMGVDLLKGGRAPPDTVGGSALSHDM